jgi:hypothetical protein
MKKLKLEELEVTSFETTSGARRERGTVLGHDTEPTVVSGIETYHVENCGESQYFDCTYGCSMNTDCENTCIGFTQPWECVRPPDTDIECR